MLISEQKVDLPNNLRFVFVSDFHFYPIQPILDTISEVMPNAVLVGGDFINGDDDYEDGFRFLKLCSEKFPTFVSIGNHERKYTGDLKKNVEDTGAILLDNSYTQFRGISIGGLSSAHQIDQSSLKQTPNPNTDFIMKFSQLNGYRILLCHHPEYYELFLKSTGIDVILSGHAHGGQWRIGKQGVFAPGQGFFPKYTSGIYHNQIIVSRGIGNNARLPYIGLKIPRINNPPEIILISKK